MKTFKTCILLIFFHANYFGEMGSCPNPLASSSFEWSKHKANHSKLVPCWFLTKIARHDTFGKKSVEVCRVVVYKSSIVYSRYVTQKCQFFVSLKIFDFLFNIFSFKLSKHLEECICRWVFKQFQNWTTF